MKISSITTNTGYLSKRAIECAKERGKECAEPKQRHNLKQLNNDQINTTIKSNSDGRVSFKGAAAMHVPMLHRMANFATDNPLVAEALFAILITCGLRPISIMATAKSEEDKEKCTYQAAKSISSGLVGLGTTALVGTPIAAATKRANAKGAFGMPQEMKEKSQQIINQGIEKLKELALKLEAEGKNPKLSAQIRDLVDGDKINLGIFKKAGKNAEKLFKQKINEKTQGESANIIKAALKEQRIVNNYASTGKNVADKFFQPIFMPLRATVTIALVPIIIGLLGIKKSGNKPKQEGNKPPFDILNYNVFRTNNEKELFSSFAGVANHEN